MTIGEILDNVAHSAGDNSADYRSAARRWLNAVRSYIANTTRWRWAIRPEATITTSAANTSGIYAITGYEFIVGQYLFDQTNDQTIQHESLGALLAADQDKSVTGPPSYWGDAGSDAMGERQIQLWPIPSAAYTILFAGYTRLTDLTDANDGDSTDPFFGPVTPWLSTLLAGIRYFQDLDNNEDAQQIVLQEQAFRAQIRDRRKDNRLSATSPVPLKRQNVIIPEGRFDPAHYNNR